MIFKVYGPFLYFWFCFSEGKESESTQTLRFFLGFLHTVVIGSMEFSRRHHRDASVLCFILWLNLGKLWSGLWYSLRAVASLTVPGGQEFQFPNFSSKSPWRSIFLISPQTLFIFFLILTLRVGESPTREGLATLLYTVSTYRPT